MNSTQSTRKLNLAIIGYGKMGKEIERIALDRGHTILYRIDSDEDWVGADLSKADVALEFSQPSTAITNIRKCFSVGLPIVVGTTGWYQSLEEIRKECIDNNHTLFVGSNFSISVNIFFEINRKLASMMNEQHDYEVNIEEIHHLQKLDAPSGTAIVLANDIIQNMERKLSWINQEKQYHHELEIKSLRQENVPGTHVVTYDSVYDTIEIRHTAKNRRAFALGAVMAAEWVEGKKGFFEMKDMLSF